MNDEKQLLIACIKADYQTINEILRAGKVELNIAVSEESFDQDELNYPIGTTALMILVDNDAQFLDGPFASLVADNVPFSFGHSITSKYFFQTNTRNESVFDYILKKDPSRFDAKILNILSYRLLIIAQKSDIKLTTILGIDNVKSIEAQQKLIKACSLGLYHLVAILISMGVPYNDEEQAIKRNADEIVICNPLFAACIYERTNIINLLLSGKYNDHAGSPIKLKSPKSSQLNEDTLENLLLTKDTFTPINTESLCAKQNIRGMNTHQMLEAFFNILPDDKELMIEFACIVSQPITEVIKYNGRDMYVVTPGNNFPLTLMSDSKLQARKYIVPEDMRKMVSAAIRANIKEVITWATPASMPKDAMKIAFDNQAIGCIKELFKLGYKIDEDWANYSFYYEVGIGQSYMTIETSLFAYAVLKDQSLLSYMTFTGSNRDTCMQELQSVYIMGFPLVVYIDKDEFQGAMEVIKNQDLILLGQDILLSNGFNYILYVKYNNINVIRVEVSSVFEYLLLTGKTFLLENIENFAQCIEDRRMEINRSLHRIIYDNETILSHMLKDPSTYKETIDFLSNNGISVNPRPIECFSCLPTWFSIRSSKNDELKKLPRQTESSTNVETEAGQKSWYPKFLKNTF